MVWMIPLVLKYFLVSFANTKPSVLEPQPTVGEMLHVTDFSDYLYIGATICTL